MQPLFRKAIRLLHSEFLEKGCFLCPRSCGVDRLRGQTGYCGIASMRLYSFMPHHGEEPPISGTRGSGTVFFSGCSLQCAFCQNHIFSDAARGSKADGVDITPERLSAIMNSLQAQGCHNINLVTPSHSLPFIIEGLSLARKAGLIIPVVYNCSGYEKKEVIELLDGLIDVYLPDFKYADSALAARVSNAADYPQTAYDAISRMYRQAGPLELDSKGIALKGVLVRHLILPGQAANSIKVLEKIASISKRIHVSIMSQYHPEHRTADCGGLDRMITSKEYDEVVEAFMAMGFEDGFIQDRPNDKDRKVFAGKNLQINR